MNWFRYLQRKARSLFGKPGLEADMDDEMRSHIEMQTQENIESGMSAEEARQAALRQFGWAESVKNACRDQRGAGWAEHLAQDMRFAARMLQKNLKLTLLSVATLALGIGATSAVFTVANTLLLKPMPWPEPGRVVSLWEANPQKGVPQAPLAAAQFLDARELKSFSALAAWGSTPINIASEGATPARFPGAMVTEDFFRVVKTPPLLGGGFTAEHFKPGSDMVVILGHGVWQSRFGGRSNVLGEAIQINARARTIVGVMPPGFQTPAKAQFWAPKIFSPFEVEDRDYKGQLVLGRLADGVTLEEARAEARLLFSRLRADYPDVMAGWEPEIHYAAEDAIKPVRPAMLALVAAVAAVLLMACVNVASLLLARGEGRAGELSVRAALGASRRRLSAQLLAESALLAVLGGFCGLLLGAALLKVLLAIAPPNLPRIDQVRLDGAAILAAALACIFTGLAAGLAPAWRFSMADPMDALRAAGQRFSAGAGWLRRGLVAFQVAASVVVLIAAGLLLRGFDRLLSLDLGFQPSRLMSARIELPPAKYSGERREQFAAEALERLQAHPQVEEAAFTTLLPMQGWPSIIMRTEDNPVQRPSEASATGYSGVSPKFFSVMGMRVLRGRAFQESDHETAPLVCVVNESFARRHFKDANPLGKRIEVGFAEPPNWMEIVGVVNDARNAALEMQPQAQVFAPLRQQPGFLRSNPALSLAARFHGSEEAAAEAVRQAVWSIDKSQPLHLLRPVSAAIAEQAAPRRFVVIVLGFFAVTALTLAALGLYGVMSHAAALRTREIGVRMALGAQGRDVMRLVLGAGVKTLLIGLAAGIPGAFFGARLIRSILFETPPHDPVTWAGVVLLLISTGLLACFIPALRAARVQPMVALRCE